MADLQVSGGRLIVNASESGRETGWWRVKEVDSSGTSMLSTVASSPIVSPQGQGGIGA
jgi:hypothetical protein